ncbi:DeoR/GlpR transcriptional regulator, partial [Alicyclobacillaceae bacterium I2511]
SVNRTMMEQAGRVVVVADHSKWGVLATAHVADWEEVDLLWTDGLGGVEEVRALRQLGVEVQVAQISGQELSAH